VNQIQNFTRILFAGVRRGRDHRTRKNKEDQACFSVVEKKFAQISAVLLVNDTEKRHTEKEREVAI